MIESSGVVSLGPDEEKECAKCAIVEVADGEAPAMQYSKRRREKQLAKEGEL